MLDAIIQKLLNKEPFYAHFLLNCHFMWDPPGLPTAGVCVKDGTVLMAINSTWWGMLTQSQQMDVLKHEVLHLVFSHTTLRDRSKPELATLYNFAEDCAINQYLYDIPPGGITLASIEALIGKKLNPFDTSDYYADALKAKMQQLIDSGMVTVDDHGFGDREGADEGPLAQGVVARIGKQALGQAAGNAPEAIVRALQAMGEAKLPWKSILRNFIMKQASNTTRLTQKRINRRMPLPAPGRVRKRTLKLGVCIDSSGSVSDEQYVAFMTEIASLSSACSDLWLVYADAEVHKVTHVKKRKDVSMDRFCAGGTKYQPALDKCKELGVDAVVFFGDMDSADKPTRPNVPVLWAACGDQEPPAKWGGVVRL